MIHYPHFSQLFRKRWELLKSEYKCSNNIWAEVFVVVLFYLWRNEGEWLLIHRCKIMVKISERNTPERNLFSFLYYREAYDNEGTIRYTRCVVLTVTSDMSALFRSCLISWAHCSQPLLDWRHTLSYRKDVFTNRVALSLSLSSAVVSPT